MSECLGFDGCGWTEPEQLRRTSGSATEVYSSEDSRREGGYTRKPSELSHQHHG